MATVYNTEIVKDGLIFYIDMMNAKSYSGTGNKISDLSGSGRTSTVFNNHKCANSNSPSVSTISGFITNNLKMSNPYGSNLINKSPCTQGSVSISSPSKGNYSVSFYSAPQKKIITTNMGTTWTPVKVGSNTKYTNVNTGCNTTWTSVNTGANTTYSSVNTGSNTKYSSP